MKSALAIVALAKAAMQTGEAMGALKLVLL